VPCTTWKNWASRKTAPNVPAEKVSVTTLTRLKPRERNSESGSIGVELRRCQSRNASVSTPPPISIDRMRAELQPRDGPSTTPQMISSRPEAESSRPSGSSRLAPPRDSPSTVATSTTASTPIGTLRKKIQCQSRPCTTAPPTTGPTATPSPLMPPQMPTAAVRRFSGTAWASRVRASGITAAPPSPWIARAAVSSHDDVASPAASEASVKTTRPARNIRRRPMRSPIADAVSRNAANGSVYALTNHWRLCSDACRSVRITGSAVLTTRLSSVTMKVGMPIAARISPIGRVFGCFATGGGASVAVVMRGSPQKLLSTDN